MLGKFFQSLRTPKEGELPDPDAELALGALLVRVAKSDSEYQVSEIGIIDRILARLYSHNAVEAAKIRATCEKLHAAAPDSDTFAKLIRETTDIEERLAALDALWEVVMADGILNDEEFRIVEEARAAMGLSALDSEKSRERAKHTI